jgi:hypothetical protein
MRNRVQFSSVFPERASDDETSMSKAGAATRASEKEKRRDRTERDVG